MTRDRYPRAGQTVGLYYAMGYSGHGAQIATHMGEILADQMMGAGKEKSLGNLAVECASRLFRQTVVVTAGWRLV